MASLGECDGVFFVAHPASVPVPAVLHAARIASKPRRVLISLPRSAVTIRDKSSTGPRTVAASGDRMAQPGPDAPPERLRWWRRHPARPHSCQEPTPMSPTAFPRLDRRKLRLLLEPVVERAGAELE